MLLREFYEELAKTKDKFNWRKTSCNLLRGFDKNYPYVSYCPITAVCQNKTKNYFSTYNVRSAGKAIGLSYRQIMRIVVAADAGKLPCEHKYSITRKRLERAVL